MLEEKKLKTGKTIKIIDQQPKTIENPNIIDIKSVTIKHRKSYHKLSKAIRQDEMVSHVGAGKNSNIHLYCETKIIYCL